MAARCPAGPDPMTIMSYVCMPWGRPLRPARSPCVLLAGVEAVFHFFPVHYIPPRRQVVRAAVLIFQIVGVLPNVAAHYRVFAFHQRIVLVRRGGDLHLSSGLDQPGPTGAETSHAGRVEFLFERIEAAEGRVD